MEVKEYKGTKNDLLIGLVHRWILKDNKKTIMISINKVKNGFEIIQWAMDNKGDDIKSYELTTTPYKKKYYAMKEVGDMVRKHSPNYGVRK